jgi:hypothetical protein
MFIIFLTVGPLNRIAICSTLKASNEVFLNDACLFDLLRVTFGFGF